MIDTHGHVNLLAESLVRPVIERCRRQGVTAIVMPGTNLADSRRALELAKAYPDYLFPAVGLHPTNILQKHLSDLIGDFEALIREHRPIIRALGEVGYDFYHPGADLATQARIVAGFVRLATSFALPMIFHCRARRTTLDTDEGPNPYQLVLEVVLPHPSLRFVMHCFQGSVSDVEAIIEAGGHISLTATITYTNRPEVVDVVRAIPLDRLMIETDTPFLSPPPDRGKPNEPWRVRAVAERIADLRGLPVEEILARTTLTARQFFTLP